jgi:hypothetical protein
MTSANCLKMVGFYPIANARRIAYGTPKSDGEHFAIKNETL